MSILITSLVTDLQRKYVTSMLERMTCNRIGFTRLPYSPYVENSIENLHEAIRAVAQLDPKPVLLTLIHIDSLKELNELRKHFREIIVIYTHSVTAIPKAEGLADIHPVKLNFVRNDKIPNVSTESLEVLRDWIAGSVPDDRFSIKS